MSEFKIPASKLKRTQDQASTFEDPLPEEEYLEKMEKIIKRDFFPEYYKIEALKNPEKAEQEGEEFDNFSLNEFIKKVKSEDNEIFKDIVKKEDENWKKRLWWIFLQERKENDIQNAIECGKKYDEVKKIEYKDKSNRLAICPYESQSSMFFYKDGLQYQPSKEDMKKEKQIVYSNTRFNDQDNLLKISQKEEKKKIFQDIHTFSTPALIGLRKQFEKEGKKYDLNSLREQRSRAPGESEHQINGYAMVDMPSPSPSIFDSPIMTYGKVEDTPVRIDQSNRNGRQDGQKTRQFQFQNEDRREQAAHQLSNSIATKNKSQQENKKIQQLNTIIKSVTPSSNHSQMSKRSQIGSKLVKEIMKLNNKQHASAIGTPMSSTSSVSKFTIKKREI